VPSGSWHRLDNAARVFAALASRRTTTVFRVAVTLREPVDPAVVQEALAVLMPRLPVFAVRLRAGLFWHSLVPVDGVPTVQREHAAPCRRLSRREDGPWQFRVLVFGRRLAVECSHVLTDGAGAMTLLRSLLAAYLQRRGVSVDAAEFEPAGILDPAAPPPPEEAEDAYRRFHEPRLPPPSTDPRALRLLGEPLEPEDLQVVLGVVPVAPLRALSRDHDVSLTELLASLMLAAVLDLAPDGRRPIAVMTPVDLRRLFPSRTLRNFFLSVRAEIDPRLGPYSLEDILHDVHHSMRQQVSVRSIRRQIGRNVGAERNPLIRHVPLPIKIPMKRWLYRRRWGARYTTALSNLGRVVLPPALDEHVERFELIPNPSAAHGIGCGVVGHGEDLVIVISGIIGDTGLERAFFTRLRRLGVPVRIETNRAEAGGRDEPPPGEPTKGRI